MKINIIIPTHFTNYTGLIKVKKEAEKRSKINGISLFENNVFKSKTSYYLKYNQFESMYFGMIQALYSNKLNDILSSFDKDISKGMNNISSILEAKKFVLDHNSNLKKMFAEIAIKIIEIKKSDIEANGQHLLFNILKERYNQRYEQEYHSNRTKSQIANPNSFNGKIANGTLKPEYVLALNSINSNLDYMDLDIILENFVFNPFYNNDSRFLKNRTELFLGYFESLLNLSISKEKSFEKNEICLSGLSRILNEKLDLNIQLKGVLSKVNLMYDQFNLDTSSLSYLHLDNKDHDIKIFPYVYDLHKSIKQLRQIDNNSIILVLTLEQANSNEKHKKFNAQLVTNEEYNLSSWFEPVVYNISPTLINHEYLICSSFLKCSQNLSSFNALRDAGLVNEADIYISDSQLLKHFCSTEYENTEATLPFESPSDSDKIKILPNYNIVIHS